MPMQVPVENAMAKNAAAMPRRWDLCWDLGLLGASGVVALFWSQQARGAWSQAGYLHLAFARSLAEGHGFGPGAGTSFGDGSPLWLALLVAVSGALRPLTPDWLVCGRVAAVAAALFFAAGLWCFAWSLVSAAGPAARRTFAASAVVLVLLSPDWGAVAFNGDEALFAAGIACWGLAAVAGGLSAPLHPARLLAGCVCAGVAPLVRPEMLFFSVCLAPLLFVRWVNTPLAWRAKALAFFAGLLLAVAPGAAWLLYTVHTFGTALPNTLGAGRAAPGGSVLAQLSFGEGVGCPWLLAGGAAAVCWAILRCFRFRGRGRVSEREFWRSLDPAAWVVPAWFGLSAIFYLAAHQAIRPAEVMVTAPALTVCTMAGLRQLWPRMFGVGLPLATVYGLTASLLVTLPTVRAQVAEGRVYAGLAAAVRRLEPAAAVALAPVGEVVFLSRHRVVSLDGSLAPTATPFRWDAADDRRVWWAQGQGARYMVLEHAPEPGSELLWSQPLPAAPWKAASPSTGGPAALRLWRLPPSPTLPPPLAPD